MEASISSVDRALNLPHRVAPPPINPHKTTGVRRLGPVDIRALRTAALAVPESIWAAENATKPNRFDALDATQHIVLRFVDDVRDWRRSHDRPSWPAWRALLEPVMRTAVAPYGYADAVFPRVMLARMPPGGAIKPHVDAGPAARWPHKIHVPLQTHPGVQFYVAPRVWHFPEGEAVEVNNLGVHAVRNDGPIPRIHLIFEYAPL